MATPCCHQEFYQDMGEHFQKIQDAFYGRCSTYVFLGLEYALNVEDGSITIRWSYGETFMFLELESLQKLIDSQANGNCHFCCDY